MYVRIAGFTKFKIILIGLRKFFRDQRRYRHFFSVSIEGLVRIYLI